MTPEEERARCEALARDNQMVLDALDSLNVALAKLSKEGLMLPDAVREFNETIDREIARFADALTGDDRAEFDRRVANGEPSLDVLDSIHRARRKRSRKKRRMRGA